MARSRAPRRWERSRAIAHELATAPELGELLEELRGFEAEHPRESFEASVIRVTRRDYEKQRRVPADLRAEMTRADSIGYQAWLEGARSVRLRDLPPAARADDRAHARVHRLSRAVRRSVRPDARRPRARHEDGRGRGRLRSPPRRPRRDDRWAWRARRRLVPLRRLPRRPPARVLARDARGVGDGRTVVATRRHRAPVRGLARAQRHSPHDATLPRQHQRGPLVSPRVRARRCTSARSTRATSARRSQTERRRRSTSRRADSGRTSSGGAFRHGSSSTRVCRSCSPGRSPASRSRSSIAR